MFWPLAVQKNLDRATPFLVELGNMPFEQQAQILFFIADRLPRLYAMKLDAGGNGAYLAEVATQRYGEHLVEEVKISAGWYLAEVAPFKAAFEDGAITIPADADVVRDLSTPVYKNGIPSIPPLRQAGEGGVKRHCDAFVAGVMAYAASRADVVEYGYTPATASRTRAASCSPTGWVEGGRCGSRVPHPLLCPVLQALAPCGTCRRRLDLLGPLEAHSTRRRRAYFRAVAERAPGWLRERRRTPRWMLPRPARRHDRPRSITALFRLFDRLKRDAIARAL